MACVALEPVALPVCHTSLSRASSSGERDGGLARLDAPPDPLVAEVSCLVVVSPVWDWLLTSSDGSGEGPPGP